jgi:hypothetical protein
MTRFEAVFRKPDGTEKVDIVDVEGHDDVEPAATKPRGKDWQFIGSRMLELPPVPAEE